MADPVWVVNAIKGIHYAYPIFTFFYYLLAVTVSVCTLQNISLKVQIQRVRRDVVLGLMVVIIGTYVSEAVCILIHSLTIRGWFSAQHHIIYVLSSILLWGILVLSLLDSKFPVWFPYYGSWLISIAAEVLLLILKLLLHYPKIQFEYVQLAIQAVRICSLLLLICIFFGFKILKGQKNGDNDEESQALLSNGTLVQGSSDSVKSQNGTSYGAVESSDSSDTVDGEVDDESSNDGDKDRKKRLEKLKERLRDNGNWWTYAKSFSLFIPFVWPSRNKRLQFNLFIVALCLVAGRFLNVLVPRQLGILTDSLSDGMGGTPWLQVSLFVLYRWLNSSAGIGALRSYLWIPIDQYAYKAISTAAYNHIMNLSCDFHSNKKSGELYASIDQGRSINGFIDDVCFTVLPMLVDLLVAFGYFYYLFDAYMALIVGVVTVVYLWTTTKLGAQQDEVRRAYRTTSRNEYHVLYESMGSWTTVSYFNRIPHEEQRYSAAVELHQKSERRWQVTIYFLFGVQSLIFTLGLLVACFLAVYQVTHGIRPVGSFVTLLTYWAQLSGPLTFFANFYRRVAGQMLDAERLLELFQTKPTLKDKEGAVDLCLGDAEVEFQNASFSYDPRKSTLTDISFRVAPGNTVALVGETGGGKSTLLKLLFRFYDVSNGRIIIDGQDIRDVTLSSLREKIGVVPQDPQLFNESILENLRYAKLDATDPEVHEACKAAAIHDKIMSFPDKYNSKVGERGVKLSGGELQRISIARAILKDPKIILLDEATSNVDTQTEARIQEALGKLKKGRTTFCVAHRLSTIMNADLILVIKDGQIAEQGTHNDLLRSKGRYYSLWSKQILVKPSRSRSGSRTGPKTAPIIINDLDPKDIRLPTEKNDLAFDGQEDSVRDAKLKDKNVITQPAATEAVLKPEAPEFIPKFLQGLNKATGEPSEEVSSVSGKEDGTKESSVEKRDRRKREKEVLKFQKEAQKREKLEKKQELKAQHGQQEKSKPQVRPGDTTNFGEDGAVDEQEQNGQEIASVDGTQEKDRRRRHRHRGTAFRSRQEETSRTAELPKNDESGGITTQPPAAPQDDTIVAEYSKGKNFRTRSRRARSKSAPDGQTDGGQDSEINPAAVRTGNNPPSYQQRRVSAPSDPPASPKDMKGASQGQRRRRRHWRNREKNLTASSEGTTRSSTEGALTQAAPTPFATPLDSSSRVPQFASGPNSVRFAPGS